MTNRRIDQAVDMGIGAGLMYFLDPEIGERRRKDLQDKAMEQLQLAGDALVAAGKQAEDAVLATAKQAQDALLAAGKQAEDALLSARKQAEDAIVSTGRQAQGRASSVVPAAKFALFQKLVMDEELRNRAKDVLADRSPFARRRTWPVSIALMAFAAAAIGAGLMFILDPEMGRRRRAMLRDRFIHAERVKQEAMSDMADEARNRAAGAVAEARSQMTDEQVPDHILAERVRANLGGVTSHPGSIKVTANRGIVTLSGPILADEVEALLAKVRMVPGAKAVENQLEVHQESGRVPGLQGGKAS